MKKNNTLRHAVMDQSYPIIVPAKTTIPEWFKTGERFANSEKVIKRMPAVPGFKLCSAFSDAFISGYILPLPVDIAVEQTENGPIISWNDGNVIIVEQRDSSANPTLPTPHGYSNIQFAWRTHHVFEIPKGYSALVTHPLNRVDLPFLTLSGIIDGEFIVPGGNVPVFFNNEFEGVIPAGTPIYQIILFKRENWTSKLDNTIIEKALLNGRKSANKVFGWYKNAIWQKKNYD